jgi:hypothetical protein
MLSGGGLVFRMSNATARTTAAAALAALMVVACGSSTAPSTTTNGANSAGNVPGSSSQSTSAASASTPASIPAACSLLTAAQVTALLGGPAAPAAGTEDDFSATYKSCDWLNTPAGGGNSTALDFRVVVRANQTAPGFSGTIADDGPSGPVSGVGDNAVFAATDGTGANLIVNKGLTAISISTQGPAAGSSMKSTMGSDVEQALTEIGA